MRAILVALALAAAACGTTMIRAGDPHAAIYVDGTLYGHGAAEVRKRGVPSSFAIDVRYPGGGRARKVVSRRFTGLTFVAGLFSYGIGMFTVWELPDEITLPPPPPSGWDGAADDPWMRAPSAALQSPTWSEPPSSSSR